MLCRIVVALILLLVTILPCQGQPRERKAPAQRVNGLKVLAEGDLRLKRLFLALAAADLPLVLQELDATTQRFEALRTALQAQGPAWNTPQWNKAFNQIGQVLNFGRFQVEVRLGSVTDLDSRVNEFLAIPELLLEQKVGFLTSAARAGLNRGRLTEAQAFIARAEKLAGSQKLTPVALYNLRTARFQTRGLDSAGPAEVLAGFRQAWEPLRNYQNRVDPLDDAHWLLAREASRYWIEELSRLGPEGTPSLLEIYRKSITLKNNQSPWDEKSLDQRFGVMKGYAKPIADLSVLAAAIDQIVSVAEELPPDEFLKNECAGELAQIEGALALVPGIAKLHCNKELDPSLVDFALGQGGLIQEIKGRRLFLKAKFADPAERGALIQEGLACLRQADQTPIRVRYLLKAGELAGGIGEPGLAEQSWTKAAELARDSALTIDLLEARERLADFYLEKEQYEQAKEQAVAGLETLKEALPYVGRESRGARELANRSHRLSSIVARASLAQDDSNAAIAALTLGGQVQSAASQMSKETNESFVAVETKKKKVAHLTEQVETLKELPPSETRDSLLTENERLLADSKAEFLSESRKIREENSALYSSVLRFDPLDLPDVQTVIPEDTAVVQYFPTEKELFIFVVSRDTFVLRSVDIGAESLDEKVVALLSAITRPGIQDDKMNGARRQLYDALIAPIEQDLESKKALVLIPAGRLNFLPFAVLTDSEGTALLEKKLLLELAKPTDFLRIAGTEARPIANVVVYANATRDLPAATIEGEQITAMFEGSTLFDGEKASKENFLKYGGHKDVLHLATHGMWDTSDALKSHLKLAQGERLSQQEIFEMDLGQTTLVTLSACNTAMSQRHDVDFVASLAEAFWIAGSRSVVATLWSVDDDSTGLLMSSFYRGLKERRSKSQALREAQLAVKAEPRFQHPFFWGGVMLFGDWR
ncbi:MAG: CHAT domain-containing protein [Candidatus Eremiobacteraeota bacterium]|nr:CHAT domain-containing protein [Candidatus Eremiobacteraeota bacterium]